ncbi:hypothetical protein SGRI78S_05197 [Streptomyces griseus subsp. griseus]
MTSGSSRKLRRTLQEQGERTVPVRAGAPTGTVAAPAAVPAGAPVPPPAAVPVPAAVPAPVRTAVPVAAFAAVPVGVLVAAPVAVGAPVPVPAAARVPAAVAVAGAAPVPAPGAARAPTPYRVAVFLLQPLTQPDGDQFTGGGGRADRPVPPGQQRVGRRADAHHDHRVRALLGQRRGQLVQVHPVGRQRARPVQRGLQQIPGAARMAARPARHLRGQLANPSRRVGAAHPLAVLPALAGAGHLLQERQRGAGPAGAGGSAEHQQPACFQRPAQPYVPVRLDVGPADPQQLLGGDRSVAHQEARTQGVQPDVDVADVDLADVGPVEADQVPVAGEELLSLTPGARGGGGVGRPFLPFLLGERVPGPVLEAVRGAFALLLPFAGLVVGGVGGVGGLGRVRAFRGVLGPVVPPPATARRGFRGAGLLRLRGGGLGGPGGHCFVGHGQPFPLPESVTRPMCTGCW